MKLVLTFIFLVNISHLDQSQDQVTEANVTIENATSWRGDLHPNPLSLKVDLFFVQNKFRISAKLNKFMHDTALRIENSVTKQLLKNSIIPNAPPFSFS
jgi:hypothetical protein